MVTFGDIPPKSSLRGFALWVVIVLVLLALFTLFQNPGHRSSDAEVTYSQFLADVDAGRVRDTMIQGNDINGTYTDGRSFRSYVPYYDPNLIGRLTGKGVTISGRSAQENVPWLVSLVMSWLPFIVLIAVWVWLSRRTQKTAKND